MASTINIRSATLSDKSFILSLIPRLNEFGPPAWREPDMMTATDTKILEGEILNPPADGAIFIAENDQNIPLGFIQMNRGSDYYNKEPFAHITNIIIAPEAEGQGIARLLITKGEEWAREQGFGWVTLSVFAQNTHAREVYRHLGFGEDIIKCVKEI